MTIHISARLAWHDHGWNSCVCRNPKGNTYCVGQFTFPGELIAERRNLELEETLKGKPPSSSMDGNASITGAGMRD